ncbi:MAG: hypothetical protein HGB08_01170 [Candidatus Moranbacteria bacterium]|nr:hypothetical protein [Candidatus Moranbacteria bacterium]
MKKYIGKSLIFAINIFLAAIGIMVIKDHDETGSSEKTDTLVDQTGMSPEISGSQSAISADRENTLRNLNNTPSQLSSQAVTTKTTTAKTTTTPASSGSSSKKTKTS